MSPRSASSSRDSDQSVVRVVVLHDDHLTAARGKLVARGIAEEMGLGSEWQTTLWNIELLDTHFAREAALDTASADVLVVALRGTAGFSPRLRLWLRRWLILTRDNSAALIAVFENNDEPAAKEARMFIESAARISGKEFFSQLAEVTATDAPGEVHEFLWVL